MPWSFTPQLTAWSTGVKINMENESLPGRLLAGLRPTQYEVGRSFIAW